MSDSTLRAMVGHRSPKFGVCIMEFDSPGIGQILKAGGAEYIFVDTEHSGFGIDTLKRLLRYMQAADIPAFVRPPSQNADHIATALDAGAEGLMLPMVSSAAEAAAIVAAMKYPPVGRRGVAIGIAHDRYQAAPPAEALAAANDRTVCIALIETAAAIADIDAIAAVPGLDMLWVGHFDLSTSLGIPGQFDHPDFIAAVDQVIKAVQSNDISLGRMVGTVDEGIALNRQGFDFICYGSDISLLRDSVHQGIDALRRGCG